MLGTRVTEVHYEHVSRSRFALVLAGALAVGTLTATPSSAADPRDEHGKNSVLSSRLQEANDEGQVRTQVVPDGPAGTDPLPEGPGSLLKYDDERYLVDIRVDEVNAEVLDDLTAAGAVITHTDPEQRVVTAGVKPTRLDDVGLLEGVSYVADILTPITHAICPTGVVTEGDAILRANTLRSATGLDGTGVTVGVLSDSYNRDTTAPTRASNDIATGDLPGAANTCGHTTPVNVVDDSQSENDEGRAMAQVVHDVAPGASVSFASAFGGESEFADNIRALAAGGADVIVDDVSYFEEPFFQPGVIDNAVSDVTAAGVQFFSSAGNGNVVFGGADVGSYETPAYRPVPCPTIVPSAGLTDCHNFNPSGTDDDFDFTLKAGRSFVLDLQWAQAQFGIGDDIDLYLLNSAGGVLESSDDNNFISDKPVEILSYENETGSPQALRIVIGRFDHGTPMSTPRMKFIFAGDPDMFSGIEYTTGTGGDVMGPTIFGHNGNKDAVTVAAQGVQASGVQSYSSHGPLNHYFGPVNGTTPAGAITPVVLNKPDVTASDCGKNSFFGGYDPSASAFRFCGTSAAAPHAAAVSALLRAARPAATPVQLLNAITTTATDRPGIAPLVEGAGLIDADAARSSLVLAVPLTSSQTITFNPVPTGTAATSAVLTGTASSGLPLTYTVDPSTAAVCSVGATTLSYLSAGTCTVHADQPGNYGYTAATRVTKNISVSPAVVAPPPPPPPPPSGGSTATCGGKRVTISGTNGNDTIRGTNGNDVIDARGGNDVVNGRGGNDVICGGNGNDRLNGNGGKDTLYGGSGRDSLNGGAGRDRCDGGAGRDTTKSC